jgi:NAD(P)-dependent dehydrogenase (short-subunit alcohol dehydrogenase family)
MTDGHPDAGPVERVLIVGGASGIGRALAAALVAEGAEVTIAGRSAPRLAAAAEALGGAVRTVVADITRESDIERLVGTVGPLDHIVTTAADAAGAYQPVADVDIGAARGFLDSKVAGPLLLAKHGAPRLRTGGSITFTSGIAAYRPGPGAALVAAANGALPALARALAVELAPVRVNVVSPGWVDTEIWETLAGAAKAERLATMAQRLPAGRVGRPEDIAHAFLVLLRNGFITGTVLHIDGGHRLV